MMNFCYDNDNDFLFERTWTRSWVPLRTTLTGERARGNIESACTHQIGFEGGEIVQYLPLYQRVMLDQKSYMDSCTLGRSHVR